MGNVARSVIWLFAAATLAVVSLRLSPNESSPLVPIAERRSAPDFAVTDINRSSFHLADYKGKVVLLNFWATWCAPCEAERPVLVDLESTYKDRGFAVVAVAMDHDGPAVVPPFLMLHGANFRVAYGNDDLAQKFGGLALLPMTWFIDRDGRIAARMQGFTKPGRFLGNNPFKDLVESLLAQR